MRTVPASGSSNECAATGEDTHDLGLSVAGFSLLSKIALDRAGLEIDPDWRTRVSSRLSSRATSLGFQSLDGYVASVARDRSGRDDELMQLLDSVAVSETWFFREQGQIDALVSWLTTRSGGNTPALLALWSAGCATGEEPVSLAIALEEAGWPRDGYRIHASDVSMRAIEIARKGRYPLDRFREPPAPGVLRRYFRREADELVVKDGLRSKFRFAQESITDHDAGRGPRFHVVFCRNVLIHLSPEGRRRAVLTLERRLHPGGVLFLGRSERLREEVPGLCPLPLGREIAYIKLLPGHTESRNHR
jgi:chemotaxis methyl-accepting protein methylase